MSRASPRVYRLAACPLWSESLPPGSFHSGVRGCLCPWSPCGRDVLGEAGLWPLCIPSLRRPFLDLSGWAAGWSSCVLQLLLHHVEPHSIGCQVCALSFHRLHNAGRPRCTFPSDELGCICHIQGGTRPPWNYHFTTILTSFSPLHHSKIAKITNHHFLRYLGWKFLQIRG